MTNWHGDYASTWVERCVIRYGIFVCSAPSCARRGGAGTADFRLVAVNCTSLISSWQSILESAGEFTVVVETRATLAHQSMIMRRAMMDGFTCAWGAPVPTSPDGSTAGRSGGLLILAQKGWQLQEVHLLELEAARPQWLVIEAIHPQLQEHFFLLAYYGHPDCHARSLRDLARASELMKVVDYPFYIVGDFNLTQQLTDQLDDTFMVDAAQVHAARNGVQPEPTFYSTTTGHSRPDRIFMPRTVCASLLDVNVLEYYGVAGHLALEAVIRRISAEHLVAMALPALELQTKRSNPAEEEDFITNAEKAWKDVILAGDVNVAYEQWSATWELYLATFYAGNEHFVSGRGRAIKAVNKSYSPLRPCLAKCSRRLAVFVRRVETLLRGPKDPLAMASLWQKVSRASVPMAQKYGVPNLPMDASAENIHEKVLSSTLHHYRRALTEEHKRNESDRMVKYRDLVNKTRGINKKVAGILKKGWFGLPKVTSLGRVLADPCAVLAEAAREWKQFFDGDPAPASEAWCRKYVDPLPRATFPMTQITGKDIRASLRRAKKQTAPSADSWRMAELHKLPDTALDQLASLYLLMEQLGEVPESMRTSWTALTSSSPDPILVLKLRPIAVLSAVWRVYGMTRLNLMTPYLIDFFPEVICAYLPNRSAQRAAIKIVQMAEQALMETDLGQPQMIHVVGLDASKAFPSISRLQMATLMRAVGMNPMLIATLESFYKGHTCFRIGGRYCHSVPHALRRGVHQGCPLSVMMYNLIQLPLASSIASKFDKVQCSIYADDVVIVSRCERQLQQCLNEVTCYMRLAGVKVNPDKSVYWTTIPDEGNNISVCGVRLQESASMRILGMTLAHRSPPVTGRKDKIQDGLHVLQRLPLALHSKQLAFGSIVMPSILYDAATFILQSKEVMALRSLLISTLRPAIHHTARSQGVIALLCLHGHRVDPLMAVLWRLLHLLQDYDKFPWPLELHQQFGCWGPLTRMCEMLKEIGADFYGEEVIIPFFEPISLWRPVERVARKVWEHQWRERLRDCLLRHTVVKRSDFQQLKGVKVDWTRTMALHHSLDNKPIMRTYLEIVLSGALLTRQRTRRSTKDKTQMQCPFGCKQPDTAHHRYWSCCRWAPLRTRSNLRSASIHPLMQHVGFVPDDSSMSDSLIVTIQTFMATVALESMQEGRKTVCTKLTSVDQEEDWSDSRDNEDPSDFPVGTNAAAASAVRACGVYSSGRGSSGRRGDVGHGVGKVLGVYRDSTEIRACLTGRRAAPAEPEPKARALPELPAHIISQMRGIVGSKRPPTHVLTCCTCGGSGNAIQYTRFLRRHASCAFGHDNWRRPKRILSEC